MRTNIYVDGFNLYYGALKGTLHKWLNLSMLVTSIYPRVSINRIRYFTAHVMSLAHDIDAPVRQNMYLRALKTIPQLEIHEGRFALREVLLPQYPLAYINGNHNRPPQNVQVLKPEEKRSDVNLATLLLLDCFQNDCDEAILISNDSDLTLPVSTAVTICGKKVHIINPQKRGKLSSELSGVATSFIPEINKRHLVNSQFPVTMTDSVGSFTKPASW